MAVEYHGQASTRRDVLTGLSREIRNAQFIGTRIFPFVPCPSRLFEIEIFDKDLQALVNTKRALRGDSNIMMPGEASTVEGKLHEHDVGWPIDVSEKKHSIRSLERRATRKTRMNLDLVLENEHATLAQADSTYPADHVVALSGTDLWSDAASTPIDDVDTGKQKISEKQVLEPNLMVLGENVFRTLKTNAQLKGALSDNEKKIVKLEDMKELFEIEEIVVGKAVYYDPVNQVHVKLWKDHAMLFYVNPDVHPENPDEIDLSWGFTYREKGYPYVDDYFANPGKVQIIRTTDSRLVYVNGSECGYKIKAL